MSSYDSLIAQELKSLPDLFTEYFPASFQPSRAVSFGCGILNEQETLHELYGTFVRGFDNDPQMITLAKEWNRNVSLADLADGAQFIDESVDLIIGRNIPLNFDREYRLSDKHEVWHQFLQQAYDKSASDSMLLLTFARQDESFVATKILHQTGYRILHDEISTVQVASDRIGVVGAETKDNYVILARSSSQRVLSFPLVY